MVLFYLTICIAQAAGDNTGGVPGNPGMEMKAKGAGRVFWADENECGGDVRCIGGKPV